MPRVSTFASPRLLLPLAALLATLPLMLHGNSCGQDLTFHLQSWIDAARQLRHGHYPHWDTTAAWNAGEPRFLFYPPLSWLLGATLTLLLPINAAPIAFIFLALLASGLAFHRLARSFASPIAALLASALYLANPYMLFNAFERSALAELLAAAWIPLLLLAVLRPRPTIRGIAIPLALLWLTNVPAAVMGSYLLALLATLRVLHALCAKASPASSERSVVVTEAPQSPSSRPKAAGRSGETPVFPAASTTSISSLQPASRLTLTYLAGTLLGLALPAFYLVPAAYERRFIQATMALIPPLRYQDNFLFTHTSDAAHNAVNHTASLLALTLLLLTAATLFALFLRRTKSRQEAALIPSQAAAPRAETAVILSGGAGHHPDPQSKDPEAASSSTSARIFSATREFSFPSVLPEGNLLPILALPTLIIALLLTPLSTPIWRHLPELAFLQFPWRLLTLLTPILALATALLLDRFFSPSSAGFPPESRHLDRSAQRAVERPLYFATATTLLLPLTLGHIAHHLFSQPCDPTGTPAILAHNLASHHGTLPTDEYTPADADNDLLRTGNPAFWLAPLGNPNLPAPNTVPTATELNPSIDTDDTPVPLTQTLSTPAPHHLTLNLSHPALLVLNLRDYPNWHITLTTANQPPLHSARDSAQDLQRNDGLITTALPTGSSTVNIVWRPTPDQTLGQILSALALLILALSFHRDG